MSDDLLAGTLDSEKAFVIHVEHERRLDTGKDVSVQCAVLHTTSSGQRRVRVINLALGVAALAHNVYRFSDIDATATYFCKDGECSVFPIRDIPLIIQ
jgi:protein transport protein SEC24